MNNLELEAKDLVEAAYDVLSLVAQKKTIITYIDFYGQLGLNYKKIRDRNIGSLLLDYVNERSYNDFGLVLGALVVFRDTKFPADGYFDWVGKNIKGSDISAHISEDKKLEYWLKSIEEIYKFYNDYEFKKVS